VRSGASHEVFSPSAHTGRVALSAVFDVGRPGLPASGLSRFGVSRHRSRAVSGDQPMTFALAVLRCCGLDAVSLDLADTRGGSFEAELLQLERLNIRQDATPVIFDRSRECYR